MADIFDEIHEAREKQTVDITTFRKLYPQYDVMDDDTLSRKLHAKFYPHVSYEAFVSRFIPKASQRRPQDIPEGDQPEFAPAPKRKFFEHFLIAEDKLLPSWARATRREKAEKVLRGVTGGVTNVVTKPLDFASKLFWASYKRIAPKGVMDEVKGMNLDQAVNHLAGRDPTGLEAVLGGIAAFVGPVKAIEGAGMATVQAGRIAKSAVEWGGGEAIIQLSNRLAETLDPNADYGYEGASAVLKAAAKGGAFGAIGSLPIPKAVQVAGQSAVMGGSAALEGAGPEEIITQAAIPVAFAGIDLFKARRQMKRNVGLLKEALAEELKPELNKPIIERLNKTIEAIDKGRHDPPATADQAIGKQYGLSNEQTDALLSAVERRYRELKLKKTEEHKPAERDELAVLSRSRNDVEAILSDLTSESPMLKLESDVVGTAQQPVRQRGELVNYVHNARDQIASDMQSQGHSADKANAMARERYETAMSMVHDFGKEKVTSKKLSKAELREFADLLTSALPEGAISENMWDIRVNVSGESVAVRDIMDSAIEAAGRLIPQKRQPAVATTEKTGRLGSAIRWAKKYAIGIGNLPVNQLAKILDGGDESGIYSRVLGDNIQRGFAEEARHTQIADGLFQSGLQTLGIDTASVIRMSRALDPRLRIIKAVSNRLPQNLAATTEYKKVELGEITADLTWSELLDIYLATNQPSGIRHATGGGFLIGDKPTGAVSEGQLTALRGLVESNSQVKGVADLIQFIGETHWKPTINTTSTRLDGKAIATVPGWWGLEPYDGSKLGSKTYSANLLENKSIFRPRPKSTRPLVVRDAFSRYAVFEAAIAQYVGMAEPFRIARTLVNNDAVFTALDQKGYGDVHKTIVELLRRQQIELSHPSGPLDGLIDATMPNMYKALLFFNPRVWASQYTSVAGYGSYASLEYMPHAVEAIKIAGVGEALNEMLSASPIAYMRLKSGRATLELGAASEPEGAIRRTTGGGLHSNVLGEIVKYSDIMALLGGWHIAKAEFADAKAGNIRGKSAKWWVAEDAVRIQEGSPEHLDVIRRRAEYLWQQTQSSWDPYNRSLITSSSKLTRSFFLFRSFNEKFLKVWNDAYLEYENGGSAGAFAEKVAWPVAGMVADQAIRLAIAFALYRERKSFAEAIVETIGSITRTMPIIGGVIDNAMRSLVRGITDDKGIYVAPEALDSLPVDVLNQVQKHVSGLAEGIGEYISSDGVEGGDKIEKEIGGIIYDVAPIAGVPSAQIKKIKRGWFTEEETSGKIRR